MKEILLVRSGLVFLDEFLGTELEDVIIHCSV